MMSLRKIQAALVLIALLMIALFAALPASAQDDDDMIMVSGAIDFTLDGDIFVGDYKIAPSLGFQPSLIHEGDIVLVVGTLLADGETIQASRIEPFAEDDENTDDDTVIDDGNEDDEAVDDEAEDDFDDGENEDDFDDEDGEACDNPSHPVATRLSEAFDVSYATIMAMHCEGNGFGEITRAFLLAEAVEGEDADLIESAQAFLGRHQNGEGWGDIVREVGVHPSQLAPGHVIGRGRWSGDGDGRPGNANGNANGNGHGNRNGNANGNGNGNRNGNSNGNGHGNSDSEHDSDD